MTSPNWGLAGNNALAMFSQGAQMGSQARQQREQAEFRKQQIELQRQDNERQQAEFVARQGERESKAQEAQVGKVKTMAKLLARAKDPITYAQSRAAAMQLGFDATAIPEQYDPNWVAQQQMIVQAYQDGGTEAFSTAGKVAMDEGLQPGTPEFNARVREIWTAENSKSFATSPGGGVATVDPSGQARFVIQPNDGSAPAGTPAGGVREGATATNPQTGQRIQFRGGRWVPVGGGAGNGAGNFPG